MNDNTRPQCAACPIKQPERLCVTPGGKHPPSCPTANYADITKASIEAIHDPETLRFARESGLIECHGYQQRDGIACPVKSRIQEIVEFCLNMEYKRLGLIFCMGLRAEAATVLKIFEVNGFEVVSLVCKVGGVSKAEIDIPQELQLNPKGHESMCNPIMQAEMANTMDVDFNILLGLCVGHDSLVLQRLKAPATVLAVKDRLMGHNPLAAIYTCDSYHRYLKKPLKG